jgi:D-galacturonate reductase
MKAAVLGTGMYVTGRPALGTGTVLGSLAEASRQLQLTEVIVIGRDIHGGSAVRESASTINRRLGTDLRVRYVQTSGDLAYDLPKICAKERVQLAIVSVPDSLHAVAAESFVNAGVHCMVVKPLAPTSAEARRMCEAQQRNNVLGYVEFHKRHDEANCYAKRVLSERAIGDIRYITVDYSQRLSMPLETFRSWSASVNIFQYLAVHYVDLIYFLTGALPWRASAVGTRGLLTGHGIDTFDSIHATILWRGPSSATEFVSQFAVNWIDPLTSTALSDQRYRIVGTSGRLDLDQKHRGVELVQGSGAQSINPYFSQFLPTPDGHEVFQGYGPKSIGGFVQDVSDVLQGRSRPGDYEGRRPTFRDGLVSTAVIEAVNQSLVQESRWVAVDADDPSTAHHQGAERACSIGEGQMRFGSRD